MVPSQELIDTPGSRRLDHDHFPSIRLIDLAASRYPAARSAGCIRSVGTGLKTLIDFDYLHLHLPQSSSPQLQLLLCCGTPQRSSLFKAHRSWAFASASIHTAYSLLAAFVTLAFFLCN